MSNLFHYNKKGCFLELIVYILMNDIFNVIFKYELMGIQFIQIHIENGQAINDRWHGVYQVIGCMVHVAGNN